MAFFYFDDYFNFTNDSVVNLEVGYIFLYPALKFMF